MTTLSKNERVKIRCDECNLPFWSSEQLEKHSAVHIRSKNFECPHCSKKFARTDHLKMHVRSCNKNPTKGIVTRKSAVNLQVGGGTKGAFHLRNSAFNGVVQEWRYTFPKSESAEVFENLRSVLMNDARLLVVEAAGLFKWYLGLEVVFHKSIDPAVETEPPAYFRTDPIPSYQKYDDDVWEVVKGQLEMELENYQTNGSGWIVSRLLNLDVNFVEMKNPLERVIEESDSDGSADDENDIEDL